MLQSIALRFEQHCEGGAPALRGQIRWDIADTSSPPGPVNPPPANLWRAPAGSTPASGNYVYLTSEAGDFIGGGITATYTQANATLRVDGSNGHLGVQVTGNEEWFGDFQTMNPLALQPGYYADLSRYPFHNPAKGGLSWGGEGRGCNTLSGWFVIDSITFSGTAISSVDARFEQHCESNGPALRGQIHWVAGDVTQPPGPQVPPPAGLWTPPAGATPASGNYVYLQSSAGDYIGQGQTYLYQTPADTITVGEGGGLATVQVNNIGDWMGHFQTMNSIPAWRPATTATCSAGRSTTPPSAASTGPAWGAAATSSPAGSWSTASPTSAARSPRSTCASSSTARAWRRRCAARSTGSTSGAGPAPARSG